MKITRKLLGEWLYLIYDRVDAELLPVSKEPDSRRSEQICGHYSDIERVLASVLGVASIEENSALDDFKVPDEDYIEREDLSQWQYLVFEDMYELKKSCPEQGSYNAMRIDYLERLHSVLQGAIGFEDPPEKVQNAG